MGRRRSIAAASPALAVFLSACAGVTTGYNPVATEPEREPPELVEVVMPHDLLAVFPNGHAFSVSRFVSRTLETAPDGQSRRWPTNDPAVSLVVRPESTEIEGDTVCRRATIIVENAEAARQFPYRACRTATGVWAP